MGYYYLLFCDKPLKMLLREETCKCPVNALKLFFFTTGRWFPQFILVQSVGFNLEWHGCFSSQEYTVEQSYKVLRSSESHIFERLKTCPITICPIYPKYSQLMTFGFECLALHAVAMTFEVIPNLQNINSKLIVTQTFSRTPCKPWT